MSNTYELPRKNVEMGFPFPSRLIIEPRKADGSLDVDRIGTDKLVIISSRIGTARGLSDLYFTYNQGVASASGQDIMDWLCDNGLEVRARTW